MALFFKPSNNDTLISLEIEPENPDFIKAAIELEREALKKKRHVEKKLIPKNEGMEFANNPDSEKDNVSIFSNFFYWDPGKLRVVYFVNPGITFRRLISITNSNDFMNIRDSFESPQVGIELGLHLWLEVNNYIFVRSGIEFVQFGEYSRYHFTSRTINPENPLDTLLKEIINEDNNIYNYLSFPFLLGKEIELSRTSSFQFIGGLKSMRIINAQANIKDPRESDIRLYRVGDMKKWILSPTVKIEFTFSTSGKMRIAVGPFATWSISNNYLNIPVKQKPYLIGLAFGIHTNY